MSLHRDTSRQFDARLRAVANVTDLPPELDVLKSRLDSWQRDTGTPAIDRLARSVIDGDPADAVLLAAAIAQTAASPGVHNDVITGVRTRVHAAIRDTFAAHAESIYRTVAAIFNRAVESFTACTAVCDPEMPAVAVVDATEKVRKAWKQAEGAAAELDRILPALVAAAQLAGLADDTDHAAYRLCCEDAPGGFEAWQSEDKRAQAARHAAANLPFTGQPLPTPTRCGRWSSVAAVTTIRAATPEQLAQDEQLIPA